MSLTGRMLPSVLCIFPDQVIWPRETDFFKVITAVCTLGEYSVNTSSPLAVLFPLRT